MGSNRDNGYFTNQSPFLRGIIWRGISFVLFLFILYEKVPAIRGQDSSWGMTCGGVGTFLDIDVGSCSTILNCDFNLKESYPGSIRFRSRHSHRMLMLTVHLTSVMSGRKQVSYIATANQDFDAGNVYIQNFPIMFSSDFFGSSGMHIVRIEITDGANEYEICYHFTARLNSTANTQNPGTQLGDFCQYSPAPCSFPYSMCRLSEDDNNNKKQCYCADYAQAEEGSCKKRAGVTCLDDLECVSNALCQDLSYRNGGTCTCDVGYRFVNDTGICEKGAGSRLTGRDLLLPSVTASLLALFKL